MTSVYNNYHYKHNQLSDGNPFKIFSSNYSSFNPKITPSSNNNPYNALNNQPYSKTAKLEENSTFSQNLRKTPNQLNDPIKSTSYNIINGYPLNKTMNYPQGNNSYAYNNINNQRRDHLFDLLNYTGSKINNSNYYNPNITTNNTYGAYTYQKTNRNQTTYNQPAENIQQTPQSNNITPLKTPISNIPISNNQNTLNPKKISNIPPQKYETPKVILSPNEKSQNQKIQTQIEIPNAQNQITQPSKLYLEKKSDINLPEYTSRGISIAEYSYKEEPNSRYRDYMEDKGVCIDCFLNDPSNSLFCLFDGHGGKEVSTYLQNNFPLILKEHLPSNNMTETLTKIFPLIDEKIKESNYYQVGATGNVIFITKEDNKKVIYSANIGDTRSILINSSKVPIRLSYDDRASDPSEYNRIISEGGIVFAGRIYGQLMLSRAFGDWELKEFGVSNIPHVKRIEVGNDECYVVIASDGVWDVVSDDDVAKICSFVQGSKEVCDNVVKMAINKGSMDNISCFVIKVN